MNNQENSTKSLFNLLITLAIPTVLEEILSTLLQYVDTAMVGRLGENATAAVSVTTTVSWLVHCLPSAIGIAALSMIAQAAGSGDEKLIKRVSNQLMMIVIYSGVIIGGLSVALSPFIPSWMGAEVSIRRQASIYFAIISFPMIFRCAAWILGSAIRATKDTKTPMLINMSANILNVLLNYLFIYTFSLGVTGAAIATAISYSIAGIFMYFAYRKNEILKIDRITMKPDKEIIDKACKIAVPVMATNVTSCTGYVIFASLVTGMGNTVFAAHSIAVTAETIFYIPGYGLRTATSTLVGNAVGENNRKKLSEVSYMSIIVTVLAMCLSGVVLYLVSFPLMRFFTSSLRVAEIGAEMLKLVAFSEPFFGLMIVCEGIYYGLGETKYPFYIETFCMWGIRIVATFICVRILGLGLREVWYCMIADNVCKAIMLSIPLKRATNHLLKKEDVSIEN